VQARERKGPAWDKRLLWHEKRYDKLQLQVEHHGAPWHGDGRYKLLEQIGEGGFGVVYLAEQQQPVRRKVALKVIKPGMDSKQVVARFEAERQALAFMDHANIARVLDAGASDTGRPYFVMELVRGVPITQSRLLAHSLTWHSLLAASAGMDS
jgi:serine/threonine protein kinase